MEQNTNSNSAVAGHLLSADKVRRFIFGRRAYFTLRNPITDARLTFKVRYAEAVAADQCDRCGGTGIWKGTRGGRGPCFACNSTGFRKGTAGSPAGFKVFWLSGPNKDDDKAYKLLGMVSQEESRKASPRPCDHPQAVDGDREDHARKVFAWLLRHLDALPEKCQFWHEGRCACCSRRLTDPVSIEHGIGPICRGKYDTDVPRVSNAGAHAEDQGIAASIQHAVQTLDPEDTTRQEGAQTYAA